MNLQDPSLQIATFLDPRYKDKFLGPEKENVMKNMVRELVEIENENKAKEKAADVAQADLNLSVELEGEAVEKDPELAKEIHGDFWACFEEAKISDVSEDESTDIPSRQDFKYLSLEFQNRNFKNLKFLFSFNCLC